VINLVLINVDYALNGMVSLLIYFNC
jgi:hypothetical protein